LVPPTEANFFPLVPVLVEKMNSLRQALLRTLQQYIGGCMSLRAMSIALSKSSLSKTTALI